MWSEVVVSVGNAIVARDLVFRSVGNTKPCPGGVLVNGIGHVAARHVVVYHAGPIAHFIEVIYESVTEGPQRCLVQLAIQIVYKRVGTCIGGHYVNAIHRIVSVVFMIKGRAGIGIYGVHVLNAVQRIARVNLIHMVAKIIAVGLVGGRVARDPSLH
jgi:hypothetical protein